MVAGGEHCQFRAAIEVLVPYTFMTAEVVLSRRVLPGTQAKPLP
jgi:hypothetical protein